MIFAPLGDSFVNVAAIAMLTPDRGESLHGIRVREPDPRRSTIVTMSGAAVGVPAPIAEVHAALVEASSSGVEAALSERRRIARWLRGSGDITDAAAADCIERGDHLTTAGGEG